MDLKIFKIKKKFKKSEHQPDPDFYWRVVLLATVVMVFTALFFGMRLFIEINKETFDSAVEYDGQGKKISKDRIEKVLQYFTDRENKSQNILNSPAPVSDPSL